MPNPATLLDWSPLKILRDLAATIRAILFLGAPVAVAVAWAFYKAGAGRGVVLTATIGAASTVIAACLGLFAGREGAERSPYRVITDISVQTVEAVGNHHRFTWRRELEIKSRKDGLRLIPTNWYWTGQNSSPVIHRALLSGQKVLTTGVPESDQAIHRWIYLGRPVARGETAKTGLEHVIEDDLAPMQRFWSLAARTKTETLRLTLRFPVAEKPSVVEAIHGPSWNHFKQPRPIKGVEPKQVVAVSGMVDYVLEFKHPRSFRLVGMRWEL